MVLNSGRSVKLMLNETHSHTTSFAFQRGRSVWLYVPCSNEIMSSYGMLFNLNQVLFVLTCKKVEVFGFMLPSEKHDDVLEHSSTKHNNATQLSQRRRMKKSPAKHED